MCAALALMTCSLSAGAQNFGNRSFTGGAAIHKFFSSPDAVEAVVPALHLGMTYYLGAGFEIAVLAHGALAYREAGVTVGGGGGFVFAGLVHAGARYLFSEESVRPYFGLHLPLLYVWPSVFSLGAGANAGVEWFVSDSVSIGPRASVDLMIRDLNQPVSVGLGLAAVVSGHY